jgi:anti-anti-sigma factor
VVSADLGATMIVAFPGDAVRQDDALAAVVAVHLTHLVEQSGRRQLLLNFDNVTYLSSNGLGMLITLQKQLEGVGGCFVLCNVAPPVYEAFETTRLTGLLNICMQDPAAEQGDLEAGLRLLRAAADRCAEPDQQTLQKRHPATAQPPTSPRRSGDLHPSRFKATPNPAPLAG